MWWQHIAKAYLGDVLDRLPRGAVEHGTLVRPAVNLQPQLDPPVRLAAEWAQRHERALAAPRVLGLYEQQQLLQGVGEQEVVVL